MTCTYGFDRNQAAALVLEAPHVRIRDGRHKWFSSRECGRRGRASLGVGVGAADARADGKNVWKWNEPPTSPLMRHQARRSEDLRGEGVPPACCLPRDTGGSGPSRMSP
jgi:hypothetical protein